MTHCWSAVWTVPRRVETHQMFKDLKESNAAENMSITKPFHIPGSDISMHKFWIVEWITTRRIASFWPKSIATLSKIKQYWERERERELLSYYVGFHYIRCLLHFHLLHVRQWKTAIFFHECTWECTFCISFLPSGSPIITDDLQARDASIARTLGGQTESEVSIL